MCEKILRIFCRLFVVTLGIVLLGTSAFLACFLMLPFVVEPYLGLLSLVVAGK